jgi:hypothetical protein
MNVLYAISKVSKNITRCHYWLQESENRECKHSHLEFLQWTSLQITVGDRTETVRFFHTYKRGVDRVFLDHPFFLAKVLFTVLVQCCLLILLHNRLLEKLLYFQLSKKSDAKWKCNWRPNLTFHSSLLLAILEVMYVCTLLCKDIKDHVQTCKYMKGQILALCWPVIHWAKPYWKVWQNRFGARQEAKFMVQHLDWIMRITNFAFLFWQRCAFWGPSCPMDLWLASV